jgi:hypothetical protein
MNMKRTLIVMAVLLLPALGITSQVAATDVTVTASPSYISFSSAPGTWTLNGITGGGKIDENTTYYANPLGDTTQPSATVVDGECQFTWTNDSTVNIVITCNWGSFTGGDATMTNSNTGSNGATTFGAYSWYSGMTYSSKVITKSSGSDALYTTSSPGEDKKWGSEITTRTDTWTGSGDSTATLSITAAEA